MRVYGQLKSAQLELWSSDPGSAAQVGRVGYSTTTLRPRVANGTVWNWLATSGGTATDDNHLVLAKAASAALTALTREQGSIYYDTGTNTVKYDDGSSLIEFATASGQFSLNDGLVATPSLKFTSDPDVGLYRPGTNQLGLAASQVVFPVGAAATPSLAWVGDTDTGIYRSGANQVAFAAAGAYVGSFEAGQLRLVDGTAALPAYTFNSDPDTGMYRFGANSIGLSCNGALSLLVSETQLSVVNGSAASPSICFFSDSDSGFFMNGANSIGVATGGTVRFIFEGNTLQSGSNGSAGAPNYTWDGDEDTGFFRAGANQVGLAAAGTAVGFFGTAGLAIGSTSSVDQIKWKLFTNTLAAGASVTLTAPSGVCYGVVGHASRTSDGAGQNAIYYDNGSPVMRFQSPGVGNNAVLLLNGEAQTYTYRVVMYYQ